MGGIVAVINRSVVRALTDLLVIDITFIKQLLVEDRLPLVVGLWKRLPLLTSKD